MIKIIKGKEKEKALTNNHVRPEQELKNNNDNVILYENGKEVNIPTIIKLNENIVNSVIYYDEISHSTQSIEYNPENPPSWIIFNKKGEPQVSAPLLAEHLRRHKSYLYVRNNSKENTQRYSYGGGVYKQFNDDDINGRIKILVPLQFQTANKINEVRKLLYMDTMNYITHDEINNDENIINFKNGLLYLDTMELKPHNRKVYSTIQIPANYNKIFEKPATSYFDNYIDYLTQNDSEKRSVILQFLGMAISNIKGWRPKKALFLVGKHDTGKSIIRDIATELVGKDNNSSIDLETLEARFGTSVIYEKRLVGSSDMAFMHVKEIKIFKQLTGGDQIIAEFKGENAFTYRFDGVMWFCCNELPKFGGDKGDGVYERMVVVECNNHVPAEIRDRTLKEKIMTERDYIVSLAINELKKVIDNGYDYILPETCNVARENYKKENNSFLTFMNDCTEERPSESIEDKCTKKKFYDVYVAWCKDNAKGYSETKRDVNKLLEKMGQDTEKKIRGDRFYSKFTLTYETKKDYEYIYGEPDGYNPFINN